MHHTLFREAAMPWIGFHLYVVLQVEPFLLAPLGFNLREKERRKDLLRQRSNQLKLGLEDKELPEQLQLAYIQYAPCAWLHETTWSCYIRLQE